MSRRFAALFCFAALCAICAAVSLAHGADESSASQPKVGDKAEDFTLKSLSGDEVKLSELTRQGPVTLVVLRGFPGYQCPICSRQVGSLLGSAETVAELGAKVLFVYPGPADELDQKAKEFLGKRKLPENFLLVTDPDYRFTLAWRLRWDAVRETAYPSTFVIDREGVIRFAQVSMTHGGRAETSAVLAELKKLK